MPPDSRLLGVIRPLFRYGGTRCGEVAGNADRAVLYDFRRFPAGILAFCAPQGWLEPLFCG